MATQVNIDLANIGEQIAAAVKQAVEQATNKLLAANIKEVKDAVEQATNKLLAVNLEEIKGAVVQATDKLLAVNLKEVKAEEVKATSNQDFSFDIRGQILANAQWLYTISKTYYIRDANPDSTVGPALPTPPLYILIKSSNGTYEAEIRLRLPQDDRHTHHWGFLESEIAAAAEKALGKLLRLTTELLGRECGEVGQEYSWRKELDEEGIVDVTGSGFMWTPGANAHWLWKVARSYYVEDQDEEGEPGPSPPPAPLTVTVTGADEVKFYAQVQLQQHRDDRHVHEAVFIEGDDAPSVDEALRKVLRTTTELLRAEYGCHTWRTILNAQDNVHLEGLGRMWSTTGECGDCEEQVWT
ncbi:hypothetical protein LTR56_024062 [Elasticomyces elasticus]|nr:hypothetical protein LTR56_024062 [Elasticomyces elasticus]KAK3666627.1 hypothetical protein LTR22_002571 [Elasticomyces elasticus]KAK4921680.1 hypothetical protein LTR49_010971 [Elasticomyces elasticus]KAK5758624.1 hypothetical protein LTS12_011328 [Elasticomyces elasticus]